MKTKNNRKTTQHSHFHDFCKFIVHRKIPNFLITIPTITIYIFTTPQQNITIHNKQKTVRRGRTQQLYAVGGQSNR
jgi:hypothetical protein